MDQTIGVNIELDSTAEPEVNPLMSEELALEEEMVRLGSIRFQETHNRLSNGGNLAHTEAGMHITAGGIDRVSEKLVDWLQDQWAAKNRRSTAFAALNAIEPNAASFIALRVVLNQLSTVQTYNTVAIMVGGAIEDEQRFRLIKSEAPQLFDWALNQSKQSPDPRRKRTVMVWTANKIGQKWTPWATDLKLRVGVVLVEMIRKACGIVEPRIRAYKNRVNDTTLYLFPTDATLAWIRAYNLESRLLCPVKLPMVVKPKDWTGPFDGGYWSEAITRVPLVKTTKTGYLKELELLNPTKVYSAVNALQATAWSVNTGVLQVLKDVWKGSVPVAGLPPQEDPALPSKPADIETNKESRNLYRRQASKVWDKIVQFRSRRMQCMQILSIAERFSKYLEFYFPYQLDFRGRVYTQCQGLQPQGSDLAKGLLKFAEGKALNTPESVDWWMIHGANCFGVDKVSFEDRIAWVKQNQGSIIDTCCDPVHFTWWTEADSPFMFLAWCLEFGDWFEHPESFKSHLPVSLDASCSGLQHFSAMLRDKIGATSTNLVPGDSPRDIYGEVAKVALRMLESDTLNEEFLLPPTKEGKLRCEGWTKGMVSQMWLAYGVDRKICKRPVMTVPYGSTLFSCKTFVMQAVEEAEEAGKGHPFGDFLIEASGYLATIIWNAIGEVVVAARNAMAWLQKSAKIAASQGLPVSWITPSGFPVLQAYAEFDKTRVKLALGDAIVKFTINKETNELDRQRQASGISPNFVHSCDAAALVLAVTEARERGVGSFCCIHDSFGTHAADTQAFVRTIRETFVEMYETHDVLSEFKDQLEQLGVTLPELPPKGTLDISQITQSAYCFA